MKNFGPVMRFHVVASWNGNVVLDGKASGAMAHSIAQHMLANFGSGAELPALVRVMNAEKGEMIRWEHSDNTGSGHVTILCER